MASLNEMNHAGINKLFEHTKFGFIFIHLKHMV